MRVSSGFPTGVAALLFDEAEKRRVVEERAVTVLRERGFQEVILPILDYFEPYSALVTDRARDELYRFVDRDGELLALRGDFTPMLARVLAPRVDSLKTPLRMFYRGDRIRYQEERPGRLREYYEVGAELLGVAGEEADDEILELFLSVIELQPATEVRVVLGLAGALDRVLKEQPVSERATLLAAIARRDRRAARRAGKVLLEVVEEGRPAEPEELGADVAQRLASLDSLVERARRRSTSRLTLSVDLAEFVEHTLDPELASAAGTTPYYDGFVFRAYAGSMALSVGRGGRYDRLFRRLGADLPAVGFSLSPDRLLRDARGRQ